MDFHKDILLGRIGAFRLKPGTSLVKARHGLHHIQGTVGKQVLKLLLLTSHLFTGDDLLIGVHHMVDEPGSHRTGQILHGFLIKPISRQALFIIEHRLGELPVLLLVSRHAVVVNGGLVGLLIPEVVHHIVLQKSQSLLIFLYTGSCFYSIHQIFRHAEQFHVLLVNALHTQPVAVFPHHMLSIPLLQQNLYHFTTLSFAKQETVHF